MVESRGFESFSDDGSKKGPEQYVGPIRGAGPDFSALRTRARDAMQSGLGMAQTGLNTVGDRLARGGRSLMEVSGAAYEAAKPRFAQGFDWIKTKSTEGLTSLKGKYDRWQASKAADLTIRSNGEAINSAYAELQGIGQQLEGSARLPADEVVRLRERQISLDQNIIPDLARERQQAAGVLANYYGKKIEDPLRQADSYEASIQGLEGRLTRLRIASATARAKFDDVNQKLAQLQREGKVGDANYAKHMDALRNFAERIKSFDERIAMHGGELAKTKDKFDNLRIAHGDKIRFARQLRGIQANGLSRTLAEVVPESAEEEAVRPEPATPGKVVSITSAVRSGERAIAPDKEVVETISLTNMEALVAFAELFGELPQKLREILGNLKDEKLMKPMDTRDLIAHWNAQAGAEPATGSIDEVDQKRLEKAAPSTMTLVEFGVLLQLTQIKTSDDIVKGVGKIADGLVEKKEEVRKAA